MSQQVSFFLKSVAIAALVVFASGCKQTECAKLLGRVQSNVFIIQVLQVEIRECEENPDRPTCKNNEVGGLRLALFQAMELHKQLVGAYEAANCDLDDLPQMPQPGQTTDPFGDL